MPREKKKSASKAKAGGKSHDKAKKGSDSLRQATIEECFPSTSDDSGVKTSEEGDAAGGSGKKDDDLTTSEGIISEHTLITHGDDRRYWYSFEDFLALLVHIRKQHLFYVVPTSEKDHSSTDKYEKPLFIADPYRLEDLSNLNDSILIIKNGTAGNPALRWEKLPDFLIIPIYKRGHWCSMRIELNYLTKMTSILYCDPYGSEVLEPLIRQIKDDILPILKTLYDSEGLTLDDSNFKLDCKAFDQQCRGTNYYDCGPITIQNIIDFCDTAPNDNFLEDALYTIKRITEKNSNDTLLFDLRMNHLRNVGGTYALSRIREASKSWKLLHSEREIPEIDDESIQALIGKLDDARFECLMDILASFKAAGEVGDDSYSPEQWKEAYKFVGNQAEIRELAKSINLSLGSENGEGDSRYGYTGTEYQSLLMTKIAFDKLKAGGTLWKIGTEVEGYGKFDDIVLVDGTSITAVQVKYTADPVKNKYTRASFYSQKSTDKASLERYFDSVFNIRERLKKMKLADKKLRFVFVTNHDFDIEVHNKDKRNTRKLLESDDCEKLTMNGSIFKFESGTKDEKLDDLQKLILATSEVLSARVMEYFLNNGEIICGKIIPKDYVELKLSESKLESAKSIIRKYIEGNGKLFFKTNTKRTEYKIKTFFNTHKILPPDGIKSLLEEQRKIYNEDDGNLILKLFEGFPDVVKGPEILKDIDDFFNSFEIEFHNDTVEIIEKTLSEELEISGHAKRLSTLEARAVIESFRKGFLHTKKHELSSSDVLEILGNASQFNEICLVERSMSDIAYLEKFTFKFKEDTTNYYLKPVAKILNEFSKSSPNIIILNGILGDARILGALRWFRKHPNKLKIGKYLFMDFNQELLSQYKTGLTTKRIEFVVVFGVANDEQIIFIKDWLGDHVAKCKLIIIPNFECITPYDWAKIQSVNPINTLDIIPGLPSNIPASIKSCFELLNLYCMGSLVNFGGSSALPSSTEYFEPSFTDIIPLSASKFIEFASKIESSDFVTVISDSSAAELGIESDKVRIVKPDSEVFYAEDKYLFTHLTGSSGDPLFHARPEHLSKVAGFAQKSFLDFIDTLDEPLDKYPIVIEGEAGIGKSELGKQILSSPKYFGITIDLDDIAKVSLKRFDTVLSLVTFLVNNARDTTPAERRAISIGINNESLSIILDGLENYTPSKISIANENLKLIMGYKRLIILGRPQSIRGLPISVKANQHYALNRLERDSVEKMLSHIDYPSEGFAELLGIPHYCKLYKKIMSKETKHTVTVYDRSAMLLEAVMIDCSKSFSLPYEGGDGRRIFRRLSYEFDFLAKSALISFGNSLRSPPETSSSSLTDRNILSFITDSVSQEPDVIEDAKKFPFVVSIDTRDASNIIHFSHRTWLECFAAIGICRIYESDYMKERKSDLAVILRDNLFNPKFSAVIKNLFSPSRPFADIIVKGDIMEQLRKDVLGGIEILTSTTIEQASLFDDELVDFSHHETSSDEDVDTLLKRLEENPRDYWSSKRDEYNSRFRETTDKLSRKKNLGDITYVDRIDAVANQFLNKEREDFKSLYSLFALMSLIHYRHIQTANTDNLLTHCEKVLIQTTFKGRIRDELSNIVNIFKKRLDRDDYHNSLPLEDLLLEIEILFSNGIINDDKVTNLINIALDRAKGKALSWQTNYKLLELIGLHFARLDDDVKEHAKSLIFKMALELADDSPLIAVYENIYKLNLTEEFKEQLGNLGLKTCKIWEINVIALKFLMMNLSKLAYNIQEIDGFNDQVLGYFDSLDGYRKSILMSGIIKAYKDIVMPDDIMDMLSKHMQRTTTDTTLSSMAEYSPTLVVDLLIRRIKKLDESLDTEEDKVRKFNSLIRRMIGITESKPLHIIILPNSDDTHPLVKIEDPVKWKMIADLPWKIINLLKDAFANGHAFNLTTSNLAAISDAALPEFPTTTISEKVQNFVTWPEALATKSASRL